MPNSAFHLDHPPLHCVAARVQFAPIAKIREYAEDLQEALRLQGYLHFSEQKTNALRIDQNAQAGTNFSFSEVPQWNITDRERKITLRLDSESLTIIFGNYTKFSLAQPDYQQILETVEKTVKGIAITELQLRYINHIPLAQEDGAGPDKWVKPVVLGMPNLGELHRAASVSETSYQTPEGGRLIVRCSSLAHGLTLPPDLLPLDIEMNHPLQSQTPFVLLENVHARKAQESKFSAESCLKEFCEMRTYIHTAFQETVTPEALKIWK